MRNEYGLLMLMMGLMRNFKFFGEVAEDDVGRKLDGNMLIRVECWHANERKKSWPWL